MSDRDAQPWWDALGRGELVLQRCASCDAWRWPARAMCNRCGSFDARWEPACGRGTIASWIVNHHAFDAATSSPYVVLMVRLDEQDDVVLPGAFAGPPDGTGLAVGARVQVEIVRAPASNRDDVPLLQWSLL